MHSITVKINASHALVILLLCCAVMAQFTSQVSAQTWNWTDMNGPWRADSVTDI